MKLIKQFATEAPRTFAITIGWLVILMAAFVWNVVKHGFWLSLLVMVGIVAAGIGWALLNRWATKGDGLDEPKVVVRLDATDVPLSEAQLRAYQEWLQQGGTR